MFTNWYKNRHTGIIYIYILILYTNWYNIHTGMIYIVHTAIIYTGIRHADVAHGNSSITDQLI